MKFLLTLLLGGSFCAALSAAAARQPNIILFLIDDQDKESIGAFGGKTYTPTLDRLAREGLGFSWAKHVYPGNLAAPYASHNVEWTTAAALEFIELNQNRPFYLHYCTTLLHGPERSWRRSLDHPLDSGAGRLPAPLNPSDPIHP